MAKHHDASRCRFAQTVRSAQCESPPPLPAFCHPPDRQCHHATTMSSHATAAKGVEAGEGVIPVETLLAATSNDPDLQKAIHEADENGGELREGLERLLCETALMGAAAGCGHRDE